ncbi:MAG: cupin domain-containing protein [Solirubrobacteraceae bacterium]
MTRPGRDSFRLSSRASPGCRSYARAARPSARETACPGRRYRAPRWDFGWSRRAISAGSRAHTSRANRLGTSPSSARLRDSHTPAGTSGATSRAPRGRRHRHPHQEETFVVLEGRLTMYVGEPPERVEVPRGGVIHIDAMTPLQAANHGDQELLVYAYGYPPEDQHAELLDSAL